MFGRDLAAWISADDKLEPKMGVHKGMLYILRISGNLAAHMYAYFWTCWLRTRDELLNLHLALPAVCKYMQCHASQRREGCCEAPPCIALRVKRLHTEIWRHLSPRCRRRKREVPENLLARTVLGSLYQVLVLSLPSLP